MQAVLATAWSIEVFDPSSSHQLIRLPPASAHSIRGETAPAADRLGGRPEAQHQFQHGEAEDDTSSRVLEDREDTSQSGESKKEGSHGGVKISFSHGLVVHIPHPIAPPALTIGAIHEDEGGTDRRHP
jgi:hypothetical protein